MNYYATAPLAPHSGLGIIPAIVWGAALLGTGAYAYITGEETRLREELERQGGVAHMDLPTPPAPPAPQVVPTTDRLENWTPGLLEDRNARQWAQFKLDAPHLTKYSFGELPPELQGINYTPYLIGAAVLGAAWFMSR